jgi:thiamine-monophosphate kinase
LTGRPRTPEFDRIAEAFGWSRDPALPGDDAALLPGGRLLCCDALAEGAHFRLDWSGPADVGWKAVAANVADILAMGGVPDAAVWSIGMGREWDDRVFLEMCRGAREACEAFGCSLVGGDTVRCDGPGFASLSLLGTLAVERPWKRSDARVGDILCAAGSLGLSAAGWAALRSGRAEHPSAREPVSRHRRPMPPVEAALRLRELPVGACIDISDGLSSEAAHIATASGVRLVVERELLEIPPDLSAIGDLLGLDPMDWILHGGEEHSLLLTLPADRELPEGVRRIGRVESGAGVVLQADSGLIPLRLEGWVHR